MPVLNAKAAVFRQAPVLVDRNDPVHTRPAGRHLRLAAANVGIRPADDADALKLLASHPALGTLPEAEQAALFSKSRLRVLNRHQVVLRQGDPVSAVIIVVQGFLKVSTTAAGGDEVVLEVLGPGNCRLELNALLNWPTRADLVALSACQLLMIDARHFRQAMGGRTDALLAILRLASEQLEQVTKHRIDYHQLNAGGRLAKLLMRLARLQSARTSQTAWMPLRLSQGELGAMTGMSREFVNKYLASWREAGWVRMTGGHVTSIDVGALAAVSGYLEDDDGPSGSQPGLACPGNAGR